MLIFIRSETYPNESRCPLVPEDVATLQRAGFTIMVEQSKNRIFANSEYSAVGATITTEKWHDQAPGTLILGLKDLADLSRLCNHTHIYFSHSFKNQSNSTIILEAFQDTGSTLYDLEYFCEPDGKRSLSFGFYAGLTAAALGLRQDYNKNLGLDDISDLAPWTSNTQMYDFIKVGNPKIAIIGKGRCSQGVQQVCNKLKLSYDLLDRHTRPNLHKYTLVFNCILLETTYNQIWLEPNQTAKGPIKHIKHITIVDLSCDYTKPNNPLPIYTKPTSWKTPVYNYASNISVIAIENLPSLLPRESSTEFSRLLKDLLLSYGDLRWQNNLMKFKQALKYK